MEKYYIVYNKNLGYYVGYKNKIEDEYNKNFIFAKRYKTLGSAITRSGLIHGGYHSVAIINRLENNEDIFEDLKIEIIKIPNDRYRKLKKLKGENYEEIKNLGQISNDELIKYFKKESDKFLSSRDGKYFNIKSDTTTATEEYIDEWCEHMDNLLKK